MVLKKVTERGGRVRHKVLHTLSWEKLTGRVVAGAVAVALLVVVIWGGLHYLVDKKEYPVPSPMYVFLLTRLFFVSLLLFIMGFMIWSCVGAAADKR